MPYNCKECSKEYNSKSGLHRHLKSHDMSIGDYYTLYYPRNDKYSGKPLPFKEESFDACFSHMLYCMAFTTKELINLSSELQRIIKPKGINIYTVRHIGDADYGDGIHRGENLYETGGFIVHFFSKEKIKTLSTGFEIKNIEKFEEGRLPRKLFLVASEKK